MHIKSADDPKSGNGNPALFGGGEGNKMLQARTTDVLNKIIFNIDKYEVIIL